MGKEGWRRTLFPLERDTNIDLVRPVKSEVKGWLRKVRRGHLIT